MRDADDLLETIVRTIIVLTALLVAILVAISLAGAQTLSEVDTLKAENLKLKAQLLELQRGLAQCQLDTGTAALNTERTKLEAEFRAVLKPQDGETFNWTSLKFEKPPPATNGPPPK